MLLAKFAAQKPRLRLWQHRVERRRECSRDVMSESCEGERHYYSSSVEAALFASREWRRRVVVPAQTVMERIEIRRLGPQDGDAMLQMFLGSYLNKEPSTKVGSPFIDGPRHSVPRYVSRVILRCLW